MSVCKSLRFEVFKRDKFTCQYCGRKPPEVVLNADHVLAVSLGGLDLEENLVTSCWDCNIGKSNRPIDASHLPVRVSIEDRKEKLEQMRALQALISEEQELIEEWVWDILELWAKKEGQSEESGKFDYDERSEGAVRKFLGYLVKADVVDAVNITFERFPKYDHGYKRFKFFCGVCWRKIKGDKGGSDVR